MITIFNTKEGLSKWSSINTFNTGSVGSNPGRGAKILHALGPKKQNIKQE